MLVGTVFRWAGETLPSGCYKCNGTSVDRGGHMELYAVIGSKYGADQKTFKLPTLEGGTEPWVIKAY